MVYCVICDDNDEMLNLTHQMVSKEFASLSVANNITSYNSSQLLHFDITEFQPVDLAILDIEMPIFSGIDLAKELKTFCPKCTIIFLTSHNDYSIQSYEYGIYRYIPKTLIKEKLPKAIQEAVEHIETEYSNYYTVSKGNSVEKIHHSQILYIKKVSKYSIFYCLDGRAIKVRKPFKDVRLEFGENEFVTIDRGCMVNIVHIQKVYNGDVFCKNNIRLPISRANIENVKNTTLNFWGA